MKKKCGVLVTGAAGFIGSFLCERLVKEGYFVLGVDNLFRGNLDNLNELKGDPLFQFHNLDLSKIESVSVINAIILENQINVVFHLAAINGTQHFYDHSFFVLDQNIRITQNLLQSLESTPVKYLIYTSSSEVYGEPKQIPTPETHLLQMRTEANRDSYASSKALCEFYVRLYCEEHKMNGLILRVFNTYGGRMVNTRYGQVIPEFIQRILSDEIFTIIGEGSQTRSFCYIADLIELMVRLLQKNATGILNLGNPDEITINELAFQLHMLFGKDFSPVYLPARLDDHLRRSPDISKLHDHVSIESFTELKSGLKKVIDFYKNK